MPDRKPAVIGRRWCVTPVLDLTQKGFGSVPVIRFDCAEPGPANHADLVTRGAPEITLNDARLDLGPVWSRAWLQTADPAPCTASPRRR
jgi:hypothetical protein